MNAHAFWKRTTNMRNGIRRILTAKYLSDILNLPIAKEIALHP